MQPGKSLSRTVLYVAMTERTILGAWYTIGLSWGEESRLYSAACDVCVMLRRALPHARFGVTRGVRKRS